MKSTLIFLLGLFLPVVSSFIVPSSLAQQQQPTTTLSQKADTCRYNSASSSSSSSLASQSVDTMASAAIPKWFQHEISITAPSRGCHLITSDVNKAISSDMSQIKIGMCNLFIQHTSASLTVNENADPDVRRDLEAALNKIVPASWNHDGTFRHTMEGDDDMPGHVKTSLMGPSLNIPIRNGKLALGTWQGIYLNEHRDQGGWGGGHKRNIIITLQGQS
ncbi:secondary thiamine-phosphate synthase enzyme [Nitzschia inconspicua]|uniref:Secondary thiamine-phosphate synthase enzyme n=1 Tax=Nitzschia inconspicua TaxID=303405 RepID=A0A9K3PNW0_9STRA|nr:secondary thiamine-phosphate synthase enzyme [Nitzschia inconspicua]